jgi:maleate isomerase
MQAGTPVGAFEGVDGDEDLIVWLSSLAGVPAVTMSRACVDALTFLGVRSIAMATPYRAEVHAQVESYLKDSGFNVARSRYLGITKNLEINRLDSSAALETAREVVGRKVDVDGVFISCGGWPTFEIIHALEQELGVPVVTSNSAGLWKTLRMSGVNDGIAGLGKLFVEERRSE